MTRTRKSSFTLIDMAIITAVALLVASLLLRTTVIEAFKKTEYVSISYVYEIPQIETDKAMAIADGTTFIIEENGDSLGEVTAVTGVTTPTTTKVLSDGTEVSVLNPFYRSVIGTADAVLEKREDGFYTESGELFAAGRTFEVFDGESVYTVRIARIEPLEQND